MLLVATTIYDLKLPNFLSSYFWNIYLDTGFGSVAYNLSDMRTDILQHSSYTTENTHAHLRIRLSLKTE